MKGSVKLPVFIDDARKLVNTTQLRAKYLGASYEAEYCQWQTLHGLGSLMETASLIITPNAYLEGKLLASYPPDPIGDFDVTRATTATRVNSAGLVELVPYNLLTYSEDFSNAAWTKSELTLTSGQSSPLGTNTAFKITGSSAVNAYLYHSSVPVTSGNTYTASVYLKGATSGSVSLRVDSGSTAPNNPVSYTTEWQRFTYTFTAGGSTADVVLGAYLTWTGNEEIYVYGFQLVEGSVAKDYQKTETRLNIPRLDYSNGTCPSLLVEPQRTNLARWSSSFDNSVWTGLSFNATVTANDATAPDGTLTADKVVFGTGGYLYQEFVVSGLASATISIYSKTSTQQIVFGGASPAGTDVYSYVDVGNGWYRQLITRTFTSGGTGVIQFLPVGSNQTLYFWGAQLEEGSYATSYIPTTSASVTRNADVISKTGISSLIGQTEGTMYAEIDFKNLDKVPQQIMELHQDANNRFGLAAFWDGFLNQNRVQIYQFFGGNLEVNIQDTLTTGILKIACAYKQNDYVLYMNGQQIGVDTSASVPTTSILYLGSNGSTFFIGNGINSAALWKTRLTNTQLAQLTTI